ncbi:uncharacterized protein JCM10292_004050 [Rhodotorula paludigena]|uniref:uncharacterized protein n=1 Tax=Rhodotorula paludigena TaxID=86838 RepID=UPI00316FE1CF
MLPRSHCAPLAVRAAAAAFIAPPTVCSLCTAAAAPDAQARPRSKHVARPRLAAIDWSQPSTSTIPYSPSPRFFSSSSLASASASRRSTSLRQSSTPPFLLLEAALNADPTARKQALRDRTVARELEALVPSPTAVDSSPPVPLDLPRAAFDALFARTAATESAFAAPVLKRLKSFAVRRQGWRLTRAQAHVLLDARVQRERLGHARALAAREKRRAEGDVAEERVARRGVKREVVERRRDVDECADEYWALLELELQAHAEHGLPRAEAEQAARVLAVHAHAVFSRLSPSSTPDETLAFARRAATYYARALSLSSSFDHVPFRVTAPLVPLFALDAPSALSHLGAFARHGRRPSHEEIRAIVRAHHAPRDAALRRHAAAALPDSARPADSADEDDEAAYAHARAVLDDACAASSWGLTARHGSEAGAERGTEDQLEALLRERLARVEREEALEREPVHYFVRWVGLKRFRAEGDEEGVRVRRDAVEAALRLWEATQVGRGRSEGEIPAQQSAHGRVGKLLQELVVEACALEEVASGAASDKTRTSSCMQTAVELAIRYMRHSALVRRAPALLQAVTVSSHGPQLALDLFDAVSNPSIPLTASEPAQTHAHFAWTHTLFPTFISLFNSAAAVTDPSFALRLYYSWTASGLVFPVGLWNGLWRAVGRRGELEEVKRIVHDWEETGRGPVADRIVRMILVAASSMPSPRIPALLEILAFFRSRYAPAGPEASPSPDFVLSYPYLLVPLSAYNAVLGALARSSTTINPHDPRPEMRNIWAQLENDGHSPTVESFNALLSAHVLRPPGTFTAKDLDRAGLVYNQLVAARRAASTEDARDLEPNRDTFSLLMHGFLRIVSPRAGPPALVDSDSAAETEMDGESASDAPEKPFYLPRISRRKRLVALEGALRTFSAALARGPHALPRGQQVAKLVRELAREGRFEEAKRAQEGWWSGLVELEAQWESERGTKNPKGGMWEDRDVLREMREMRWARDEIARIEAKGVARVSGVEAGQEEELEAR